jgi:PAS domain S-box-containing protein
VDLDGHWLEVNARYCQIVGRSWADLLVHTFQEITLPEDLGENLGLQGGLLAGEIPNFTVEKRYLRPDGTVVWANVTVSLIRAEAGQPRYFIVIAEDIDARKRMEEALRAAERHSRAVLDSLFSFVGVLSLDGLLLDANRAPFAAAGLTPESQIGRPFVDTFWIDHSPESRTAFGQLLGLAAGGAVVRADLPVRLATDHIAVMDVTFGPLRDETGRPVQIVGSAVDVTQRVAAEARLRQAERQRAVYQRLIEDATQAIGMAHLDARLSYINPALRELARMGPEVDVSQLTIFDLYTPETTALLQAEVLPAVMEQGRWSGELRLRTWTGEVRDTYQNAFRVDDEDGTPQACATVMTDITERKRAEEALRQASTRLAVAAEASGIGIWEWDPTTQTVTWDERQYALFGISPAERPQVTYEDWRAEVLPEDLAVYEAHLLAAVAQGQPVQGEFRIRLPDGEIRHIKAAARPYWANGTDAAPHYIGVNWDVTAERLQQRHLAQAKEAAESATEAKSRFLANMSHEIRTPLNAVIGLTQVLLHSDLDGRQRSLLAKVEIAAKTLLDIISDILDFSKIEADRLTLESSPFRLSEVIDNLAHLMALKAEEKGLDLFLRVAPDCPDALAGDPLRLQQVLLNLIGNAVKFTVQGEVRLDCALDARLGAGEGGQGERARLRFTVTDTGVGIAPAERERLFLPFSQADSSTTRRFGGTGLGLAISRQLVALMGGEIAAEGRDPLPGSRFVCTVTLPVRDWQPRGGAGLPKGLRCLIAAASASGREDLAEILTQRGAQVTTVADAVAARTALRSAQAAGGAYALLMLDLALPDPDPDPHPDPHPGDPAAARRFVASLDLAVRPRICLLVPTFHTPLADGVPPPGVDALLAKPHTPWSAMEAVRQSLSRDLATPSRHTKMRRVSPWSTHVGARILLVEDNEVNQEVVRHLLEEAGLQVDVAGSGLAALELAKSCHYDACLMDIQMPEMSGYEVTERLRAQPGTAALPILALTAHTTPEDRVRCREAGMNGFLSKPIDVRELFATLRRWLPPRQAPLPPLPRPDAGPDAGPAPPALAGMDWDEALGRMRGDQGLLRRLLATFARQQRDLPARLDRALAAADGPALRHLAHTLKGVSGNFAMHRLTALAARLELAAGQRAKVAPAPSLPAPCAALVAEVKAELAVVLIGVAAHLGETEAGNLPAQEVLPMDAPAPSLTELTELTGLTAGLVLLDGLLARHSLAASGPSAALARRWAGTPYAPALRRIAQAVDELDFAQARAALARLRAELEG